MHDQKTIAIVYRTLPQYRRSFYERLKERLEREGVGFILVYGEPSGLDAQRMDTVDLPWARKIRNRSIPLGDHSVIWQPCLRFLKGVDLVIVEQASRLLVNYILLLQNALGERRLALWGHGANLQGESASRLGEAVKRAYSSRVHWWFAYNNLSVRIVIDRIGFPEHRVTNVQNAIDTHQLVLWKQKITIRDLEALRYQWRLTGRNVALFSGAMYATKRLDLILEVCHLVRRAIPDFEVIFMGAGPEQDLIRRAAQMSSWIHYTGPKFDQDKVPFFMLSKVLLCPGAVGLNILDAFALEVPLITMRGGAHGPEIAYLQPEHNGILVEQGGLKGYAEAVIELCRNETKRLRLVEGCKSARQIYTIENMVERFAEGVLAAIEN